MKLLRPAMVLSLFSILVLVSGPATQAKLPAKSHFVKSFGKQGSATVDFGPVRSLPSTPIDRSKSAVGPDGSVTIAGPVYQGSGISITRLKPGGSLDGDFGDDGTRLLHWLHSDRAFPGDLAVTAGGATLLTADISHHCASDGPQCRRRGGLIRLRPNGNLDRRFGHNGVVIAPGSNGAEAIHLKGGGQVLVAGRSDGRLAAWQFTRNGEFDQRFGVHGLAKSWPYRASQRHRIARAASITTDDRGRIVVSGTTPRLSRAIVRFSKAGKADRSFGDRGVIFSHRNRFTHPTGLVTTPDGHIITTSIRSGCSSLEAFDRHGQIDQEYMDASTQASGNLCGREQPTPYDVSFTLPKSITIDHQGRITVFIVLDSPFKDVYYRVEKYLADGSPDLSFADSGHANFPVEDPRATRMSDGAIGGSGKLIMTGGTGHSGLVSQLDQDGQPDAGFGSNGVSTYPIRHSSEDHALSAFPASGGGFILAGSVGNANNGEGSSALTRVGGSGQVDHSFGQSGHVKTDLDGFVGFRGTELLAAKQGKSTLLAGTHLVDDNPSPFVPPHRIFVISRLDRQGQPDQSFGDSGTLVPDLQGRFQARFLITSPNRAINLIQGRRDGARIVRLRRNGIPDSRFGGQGIARLRIADWPEYKVATADAGIDNRGRTLITMTRDTCNRSCSGTEIVLVRLDRSGQIDRSFGRRGQVVIQANRFEEAGYAANGQIAISASRCIRKPIERTCPKERMLVRLRQNGKPDRRFGRHGRSFAKLRGVEVKDLALSATGSLILVGSRNDRPVALGFKANGNVPGSWGKHGLVTVNRGMEGAFIAATPAGPKSVLAAGWAGTSTTADDFLATRLRTP